PPDASLFAGSRLRAKPIGTISSSGARCPTPSASCTFGGSARNSGSCAESRFVNQDFVDLLRAFVAADVRFLIVGAYALALHGRPRATGDLDIWVDAIPSNADRILRALETFGAPLTEISAEDFSHEGAVFQIGVLPGRIDI